MEREILKKPWVTLPTSRTEVRLYSGAPAGVAGRATRWGVGSEPQRVWWL